MRRHLVVAFLVLSLCVSNGVPAAHTTDAYDISVPGSIDTPTRTVAIDNETHDVSAIVNAVPGDTLSVSVTAPSDADYRVNLYNGDRDIMAQRPGTGGGEVEFDLTGYDPGSYLLLLYKDGEYKDVLPLVISGYDVTLSQITVDESAVTVTVSTSKTTDVEDPSAVQVVFANASFSQRVTADQQDPTTYAATVSLADVAFGEYRLYAVVQGSNTAFKDGRKELLGISDATTVTIAEPPTTTLSPPTTTAPPATTTATTSPSTTVTTTTTTQPTIPNSTVSTTSTATTTTQRTSTLLPTTSQSTPDTVITPQQSTTPKTPVTDTPSIPGFELANTAIALLCVLYLATRGNNGRRRNHD